MTNTPKIHGLFRAPAYEPPQPRTTYGVYRDPKWEGGRPPGWKHRQALRQADIQAGERHVQAVGKLPCTLCPERRGVMAHRLIGGPATSRAHCNPDDWVVPLCPACRGQLSAVGPKSEERHFAARGISVYILARGLLEKTGIPERMAAVLRHCKLQAEGVLPVWSKTQESAAGR